MAKLQLGLLPLHHIPAKPCLKRAVQIRLSRTYIKKLDPLQAGKKKCTMYNTESINSI